jgi:hypothetical protein
MSLSASITAEQDYDGKDLAFEETEGDEEEEVQDPVEESDNEATVDEQDQGKEDSEDESTVDEDEDSSGDETREEDKPKPYLFRFDTGGCLLIGHQSMGNKGEGRMKPADHKILKQNFFFIRNSICTSQTRLKNLFTASEAKFAFSHAPKF